ncbi:42bbb56c-be27-4ba9-a9c4-b5b9a9f3afb8-CDS [Sclerotinia trifoliorum]|uniref:42bbb56c-be27-4ba9-a9c4-b5b9a9f3afb8-CDS n=1 Tax=Sclerotinia trifoliorum TaxID=28548 RepID=A0A8H2W4U3_9HELO|nr:42bbb56c-be27-4ba9-a9c4-b5b9a9f3afb8-CDS [Sclerotinia trifoliorum]
MDSSRRSYPSAINMKIFDRILTILGFANKSSFGHPHLLREEQCLQRNIHYRTPYCLPCFQNPSENVAITGIHGGPLRFGRKLKVLVLTGWKEIQSSKKRLVSRYVATTRMERERM